MLDLQTSGGYGMVESRPPEGGNTVRKMALLLAVMAAVLVVASGVAPGQ